MLSGLLNRLRPPREYTDGSRRIHRICIHGEKFLFADGLLSEGAAIVAGELENGGYPVDRIPFQPGDTVIDIGAHVGVISCYLGRRFPFLRIYAFEPMEENYRNLLWNLDRNRVTNVIPARKAITADGRTLAMIMHANNTGGATGQLRNMHLPDHVVCEVESSTLDAVFGANRIERCRLLKIDCEGSEHEILTGFSKLGQVEYLCGEFHINEHLKAKGYSSERLIEHCGRFIDPAKITVTSITMAQ